MPKFKIYAGLSGGFNSKCFKGIEEHENEDEAEESAIQYAREEYENVAGTYGIRDIDDIMEEDGVDEDEANEIFEQEMEMWLDWEVKPAKMEYTITYTIIDSYSVEAYSEEEALEYFHRDTSDVFEIEDVSWELAKSEDE